MIIFYAFLFAVAVLCVAGMIYWDLRQRIIPDVYLFPFLLIGFFVAPVLPWLIGGVTESAVTALLAYGLAFGIKFGFEKFGYKKNQKDDSIGLGDIKLIAAGGVWLGAMGISVAIVSSAVIAAVWCFIRKKKFVPYAPFFFAGVICALIALYFLV